MQEFLEEAFACAKLDWKRVREDRSALLPARGGRPAHRRRLQGQAHTGWQPKTTFKELVRIMVQADDDLLAAQLSGKHVRCMNPGDAIFVAGHRGMVGSALVRLLRARGFTNLLLRTRAELDLCDTARRPRLLREGKAGLRLRRRGARRRHLGQRHAAGRVSQREPAHRAQPDRWRLRGRRDQAALSRQLVHLPEAGAAADHTRTALLTGSLEPTNEAYALAKICGVRLCQAYAKQHGARFISAMPTNLYGPEDNFDLETSHVLPALIHKFHLAKDARRSRRHALGHGQPLPRIPARRRPRRGLPLPHGKVRVARTDQRRVRPAICASAKLAEMVRQWSASPATSHGTQPSPTARRANCSMSPGWPTWAGRRESASRRACAPPTQWWLAAEQEVSDFRN